MFSTMESGRQVKRRALPVFALSTLLFSSSLFADTQFSLERKPVGKGVYEMALTGVPAALYVATSQSRTLDKGGIVYRLDPVTLSIAQTIHSNMKPFGMAVNHATGTLFVGNTRDSAVTAIDAKTGDIKQSLVLDSRKRTPEVRPYAPRELVVNEMTDTVYIAGLGKSSVLWVVEGKNLTLRTTIEGLGKSATGLAIDPQASRIYMTNADNEFMVIDTASNKVISRTRLDTEGDHFYLNLSLDMANHRAFITDSKAAQLLVVDTQTSKIIKKIDLPESLAVLYNARRNEVYVTHRTAGKVSVIDASNYKVIKTIDTPVHPNSLALSADGQTLFVSVKQPGSREKEPSSPDDIIRISFR